MGTGIKVQGGDVDREGVESVAGGIARIFEAAHSNRMEQETVRAALETLGRLAGITGLSISNCTISDVE